VDFKLEYGMALNQSNDCISRSSMLPNVQKLRTEQIIFYSPGVAVYHIDTDQSVGEET
jgi:hypothetical protein